LIIHSKIEKVCPFRLGENQGESAALDIDGPACGLPDQADPAVQRKVDAPFVAKARIFGRDEVMGGDVDDEPSGADSGMGYADERDEEQPETICIKVRIDDGGEKRRLGR
jgi:hypothetical protein